MDCERKALETGIFLHGSPAGQPGVGSSTGDFERWLKRAPEVERPFLWELCEGNQEGGLPCWGPWRIDIKGSGDGHLSSWEPSWTTWSGLVYWGL